MFRTGDGWGLVRASNTGPVLVLRFEADSKARLDEIQQLVEGQLRTYHGRWARRRPPSPRRSARRLCGSLATAAAACSRRRD